MSTLHTQNIIEHKPMEILGPDGQRTGKWHYCGITSPYKKTEEEMLCSVLYPFSGTRYVGDPDGLAFGIGHCVSAEFCELGEECLGHDTPEAALQSLKDFLFDVFEMGFEHNKHSLDHDEIPAVNDLQPDIIPNARLTRLQLDKAICQILGWEKQGPYEWFQAGKTERDWRRWSKMPDYTSNVQLGQELLELMKADGLTLRYDPRGKKWLVDFKRDGHWHCASQHDKEWAIACAFYHFKTGRTVEIYKKLRPECRKNGQFKKAKGS